MKTNKPMQINIPISKIDEEQRMVWGIATSEALDSQNDIVDYEASKAAFSAWPGNIREMHGSTAVGKGIDIQYDDDTKTIMVGAKISESADGENAWIKVKEGILAGFSIGGRMLETIKDKSVAGATRITNYTLSELSLVDNPANPEAMLQMVKSFDGKLQRVEAEVELNNKLPDSWWMDKFMSNKSIKKSVYDAQAAISIASELAYLMMSESWEEEQDADQMAALKTAFDAIREFTAKEVLETDDYLGEYNEVIELGKKTIDLAKGAIMVKNELEKGGIAVVDGDPRDVNGATVAEVTGSAAIIPASIKVPKKVYGKDGVTTTQKSNVVDGVERDVNADVVADDSSVVTDPIVPAEAVPAEIPVVDTSEVEAVVDDEVKLVVEAPVVDTPVEAPAVETPAEEVATPVVPEDASEKANGIADLAKNVETLLAKLGDNKDGVELKKVVDNFTKLSDKVEKSFASLEGRLALLENQPLATKGKASFVTITKGDSEVDTSVEDLEKRREAFIADPMNAKPGEAEAIYRASRQINQEGN